MTTDQPADIAASDGHLAFLLAETVTASPGQHWGTEQCVAWIDSADKRCERKPADGYLCAIHHKTALRRLAKHVEKEKARRAKIAAKHTEQLPKLMAEREKVRVAITKLDPPTRADTAAYAGEVHPSIRKQQLARLSDTRVSELARLYDRLEKLNRVIGGDA